MEEVLKNVSKQAKKAVPGSAERLFLKAESRIMSIRVAEKRRQCEKRKKQLRIMLTNPAEMTVSNRINPKKELPLELQVEIFAFLRTLEQRRMIGMRQAFHRIFAKKLKEQWKTVGNRWDSKFCHADLAISLIGWLVCKKSGETKDRWISSRTVWPFGKNEKVRYYEVKVVELKWGGVMIGLAMSNFQFNVPNCVGRWPSSIGFHSDGWLYIEGEPDPNYGPYYRFGDIVGCGLLPTDGRIFFTKNGQLIKEPFVLPFDFRTNDLYPTVSILRPNTILEANFGGHSTRPFEYDPTALWPILGHT